MENMDVERDTSLPLGQLVKMTAPIFLFGVILPFVDMVTDLRMIIRLYVGVQGCSDELYWECQDNPRARLTEPEHHPIFASMLLGKYNLIYTRTPFENVVSVPFLLNYIASFLAWYRLEKKKLLTLVFPIFNLYSIFGWSSSNKFSQSIYIT